MANLWGIFICRKLRFNRPYIFIQKPRGYERQRLLEAYYRKQHPKRISSRPLSPELLNCARKKMNTKNFNWLYVSVWFGLRPQEIDNLLNSEMWKMETLPTGRKILWVFQTKIIALPPEDRWKPIPILFDEQHFAIKIIKDGNFKRPLLKTIRKHLGTGLTLYGGRKGFVDLMLSKGHSIENISIWMGGIPQKKWRLFNERNC